MRQPGRARGLLIGSIVAGLAVAVAAGLQAAQGPIQEQRLRRLAERQRRSPLIQRAMAAARKQENELGLSRLAPGPGAHVGASLAPTSLDPDIRQGIGRITGLLPPANLLEQARHVDAEARELSGRLGAAPVRPAALPGRFSWRASQPSIVTPSRDQGQWNTCWAFATVSTFESAYARVNVPTGSQIPLFSEQAVINCSGAGTAQNGGWWAFAYLRDFGATPYATLPYTGAGPPVPPSSCRQTTPYRALSYNYVDAQNAYYPDRNLIKQAILEHGPVAAGVFATDAFMSHLDGTVFRERFGPGGQGYDRTIGANHAIVIIGWNDQQGAWIIKNSYGPENWGVSGFGYLAYETNNIGFGAAWVDAVSTQQRAAQVGLVRELIPSANNGNGNGPEPGQHPESDAPANPAPSAPPHQGALEGEATEPARPAVTPEAAPATGAPDPAPTLTPPDQPLKQPQEPSGPR